MIAKNFFRDGMIMDLAPDNTQNSLLTNALNATFVTFNGNELSLQNDMGNARVETAMLPEGYIPIGSTELGGIIYIAAYNPFNKKCLLGSFPSPERNLEKEEIAPDSFEAMLKAETFQAIANDKPTGELLTTLYKIDLDMPILHPGDKFYVCADTIKNQIVKSINIEESWNNIKRLGYVIWAKGEDYPYFNINIWDTYNDEEKNTTREKSLKDERNSNLLVPDNVIWNGELGYIDIYLATINSENKIVKLELSEKSSGHVIGEAPVKKEGESYDIGSYRKTMQSDYDVYTAKESGKLYIIAELVTIDDFEVATKIEKTQVTWNFKTTSKYNVVPSKIKLNVLTPDKMEKTLYIDYKELTSNIFYNDDELLLNQEGEYKITYTPVMPFGELKNLSTTLTLYYNTVKKTDISEWRYYNTDKYINLRFTINSSETSNNLTLSFYSLTKDFETSPSFTITYNNLFSVSKNYTEIIYLDKDYNTNYFSGILNKNKFYRVSIKLGDTELKLDDGKTTYYLYLYTCPIFNGFYESLSYYNEENSLEVKHEEPLYNFNLINYTYGYEENGNKIYPLKFTLKSNFESNRIGYDNITNLLVSGLDKLILPKKPESENSNSVEYKYNLEVKDAYKAYLSLELDWGGMFKVEESTLEITKKKVTNEEEVTIPTITESNNVLTVFTEVTNTATLDYYPDTISVYKFKPLVYDEFTARQYGIYLQEGDNELLYARSTLTKYPMWYFFSEDNRSNKDFLTASFVPNWETGAAQDIFDKNNIGSAAYKYLDMYNMEPVQNAIKDVIENHNLTIVPHLFGFWEGNNTCYEFEVLCISGEVNTNFILAKNRKIVYAFNKEYALNKEYEIYTKTDHKILFDNTVGRADGSFVDHADEPKIWSFVMKDEEGKYIPINCFMVHSTISDGCTIGGKDSIFNCVSVGETSESMMKLVLDMLMSIYKISETTIEILFVGLANNGTLSGHTVDLNLAYSGITLNIPKNQKINNLNYDLPTKMSPTYKYIITDSENDVVDKISEVNTLYKCELDGNTVEVPNTDPNLLYYKIIQTETETEIVKLHLMDKNFIWTNSIILKYDANNHIILEKSEIRKTHIIDDIELLHQRNDIYYKKYIPTKHDNFTKLTSINMIKIIISDDNETPESFSGTPVLKIYDDNRSLVYEKILDPINKSSLYHNYEQKLTNLDIKFIGHCDVYLINLTSKDSVTKTVSLYSIQTIIPNDLTSNTGIGEYLTLKDGKLCLKSNLTGKDRSIKINAGGPDYITDWKFNSQIQFKNEFAI